MAPMITLLNTGARLTALDGENLLDLLQRHGVSPEAPCNGNGKCGKCKVVADGQEQLACKIAVTRDMEVFVPKTEDGEILTDTVAVDTFADGEHKAVAAFDIGTTTVVCYILDGHTGEELAKASCVNPQTQFGADVISRIEYAMYTDAAALAACIRTALDKLVREGCDKAGVLPEELGIVSIVGNTAMHHLLLQIDPKPLTVPPYMPKVSSALELESRDILPCCTNAKIRILPNIAGFVGADTVGCLVATRFDMLDDLTLMIDIGTNGEMVLGNRDRRIACSTAAGPAFEGAKIQCGMRGASGAVDHVKLEKGQIIFSVIGDKEAVGLCGSGLLDLVAVLLAAGDILETGRMDCGKEYTLPGTKVFLSQKDVREVQLAKAAIRAGIELMCVQLGVKPGDIQKVYLAGAFGNYLNPASACAIGMIPPVLENRIEPIGNAAGAGSCLCALNSKEFAYSQVLADGTEFLELASMPEFNDCYVDCLLFEEE